MWGLMLKDLLNLKKQGSLFLVLLILYGGLAVFNHMPELFAVFIMIGAVIPMTAKAFDERAHWEGVALTLPVSKKAIVGSKYLLGLALSLIGLGLYICFGIFVPNMPAAEAVGSGVIIYALSVLMLSLMMPLLFKLGTEKLRLIMVVMILIPVVIFATFADSITLPEITPEMVTVLAVVAAAAVLLLLAVSFFISVRIVSRKEF